MSELSRSARAPFIEKVKQEFAATPIRFDYYAQKASNLNAYFYFSELFYAAVGTVTSNTSLDTNQPSGLNALNVFSYNETTQPRVVSEIKNYPSILTGAVSSGGTFTRFSVSAQGSDWVRFAIFAGGAITATIVLSNSAAGSDLLTFTGVALVAGWNYVERKLSAGTITGGFVFTAPIVRCIVTTALTAQTIGLYEIEFADNQEIFIGNQKTLIFEALDELTIDVNPSTKQIMAYNYTADTSVDGFAGKITIKVNATDIAARSAALGQSLVKGSFTRNLTINSAAGASSALVIASNIITNTAWIGYTNRQLAVTIDGVTLTLVDNVNAVTQGTYAYTAATGVFTFAESNGKIPTIYVATQVVGQGYTYKDLENGMKGSAIFTRTISTGQIFTFEALLCQLVSTKRDQSDGNLSNTYEMELYGKKVGNTVQFFKESVT